MDIAIPSIPLHLWVILAGFAQARYRSFLAMKVRICENPSWVKVIVIETVATTGIALRSKASAVLPLLHGMNCRPKFKSE